MMIETMKYKNFLSVQKIVKKFMDSFKRRKILLSPLSFFLTRIQILCLERAIFKLITEIHEPLKELLILKNKSSSKRVRIGSIDVFGFNLKVINMNHTSGSDTNLQLIVPIRVIYYLFAQAICEHFGVHYTFGKNVKNLAKSQLDKPGLSSQLTKPNATQMSVFFRALDQTNLVIEPADFITAQITRYLFFSINEVFLDTNPSDDNPSDTN
jgi:hypothetical protein